MPCEWDLKWEKRLLEENSELDSKCRVLIPEKLRKKAPLSKGSKLRVRLEGNGAMQINGTVSPKRFIELNEGILGHTPSVMKRDPLELKEIWAK